MASVNKAIIIGNLGADPDLRYTPSSQPVAELRVATTEHWTTREGERKEQTEWHRIVVWGKQAEHCKSYLKKGRQVYVEGRLRTRQWEDKEGQKRYTTEIVADRVQFLGGPPGERGERPEGARTGGGERMDRPAGGGERTEDRGRGPEEDFGGNVTEDDIPF